jgi:hypothetical protein
MLKLTLCKKDTYYRQFLGQPISPNLIKTWFHIGGLMIGTIFLKSDNSTHIYVSPQKNLEYLKGACKVTSENIKKILKTFIFNLTLKNALRQMLEPGKTSAPKAVYPEERYTPKFVDLAICSG